MAKYKNIPINKEQIDDLRWLAMSNIAKKKAGSLGSFAVELIEREIGQEIEREVKRLKERAV